MVDITAEQLETQDSSEQKDAAVSLYEQSAVAYITASPQFPTQLCANCRWYQPKTIDDGLLVPGSCHIVKNYPLPITAQGWCDQWTMAETDYLLPEEIKEYRTPAHLRAKESTLGRYVPPQPLAVQVVKQSGARLMLHVTSNGYEDRDEDTITTAALKEYADSQWDGDTFRGDQVQLFWHDPHLVIGDIVWAGVLGDTFLVEVFRERLDSPIAKAAYDHLEAYPEGWGSSHGFKVSKVDKEGKVFNRIKKYETSVLPLQFASNVATYSGVIGNE